MSPDKDFPPDFSDVSGGSSSTAPSPRSSPAARMYTVVKGDSLSKIAKAFYGSAAKWHRIYEANRPVIGNDPDLIKPGQVFVIPEA